MTSKKYRVEFDQERVEEARARLRTLLNGGVPERIPFIFNPSKRPKGVTPDMVANDDELSLKVQVERMNQIFRQCPNGDFVPHFMTTELGQAMVPSLFGIEVIIEDNQPPYTKDRIIRDLETDLDKLPERINPDTAGLGPRLRRRVQRFIEATDGEIPVAVADYQSPYGVATKLMSNEGLMMAMFDAPELVHKLLDKVTQAIADLIRAMQRWAGDPRLILLSPSVPIPEGGLVIWDDYISVITPELHERFCRPYNMRLYEEFGPGHLHTCGPCFPKFLDAVLGHKGIKSIDICSYIRGLTRSREDLLELKRRSREAGVVLNDSVGLVTCDENRKTTPPDKEFVRRMAEGGGLLWRSGDPRKLKQYLAWAEECA